MKIKINNGNIHIPKIMREELGLKNSANIECDKRKIIITNDKKMKSRDEIKKFIAHIKDFDDDISKGMIEMAKWILSEEYDEKED